MTKTNFELSRVYIHLKCYTGHQSITLTLYCSRLYHRWKTVYGLLQVLGTKGRTQQHAAEPTVGAPEPTEEGQTELQLEVPLVMLKQ